MRQQASVDWQKDCRSGELGSVLACNDLPCEVSVLVDVNLKPHRTKLLNPLRMIHAATCYPLYGSLGMGKQVPGSYGICRVWHRAMVSMRRPHRPRSAN